MNIVTAVRRRLMEEAGLGSVRIDKHALSEDVANRGTTALVVARAGSWRQTMQTAQFPRLTMTFYAEDSRDSEGRITVADGGDKCLEAWEIVDKVMHRPTLETVVWGGAGGVRVLFSNREVEPSEIDHPISTVSMMRAVYDMKVG